MNYLLDEKDYLFAQFSDLFGILNRSKYDAKQYDRIGFLLYGIFNHPKFAIDVVILRKNLKHIIDEYIQSELEIKFKRKFDLNSLLSSDIFARASDKLRQNCHEILNDVKDAYVKKNLLRIAKNIIFYKELYAFIVIGGGIDRTAHACASVFDAICKLLDLSNIQYEKLLQQAEQDAADLIENTNEMKIIKKIKSIYYEYLEKLKILKNHSANVDSRIKMLINIQQVQHALLPSSSKDSEDIIPITSPFAYLQTWIDSFGAQFMQYKKNIANTDDKRIRQVDKDFIAKINQFFNGLYANTARFFQSNNDRIFTDKTQNHIALTAR